MDWLRYTVILGNTPLTYIYAAVAFGAVMAILHLLKTMGLARLKALAESTDTDLDDMAVELLGKFTRFEYVLVSFYVATRYLQRAGGFDSLLNMALLVVFTYRGVTIIQGVMTYWIGKAVGERGLTTEARDSVMHGVQVLLRAMIWVAAVLFVLDNLGVNITTLVTGLGIGGVAIALAAQTILGDLFNFFVILLDKPFRTGDFIVMESIEGTVEHVGLKSTHLRSLSGELLIVSNSKMISSGLRNYAHMTRRRVAFTLALDARSPREALAKVPSLMKAAVASFPETEFDRSNLASFSDGAANFETVYFLKSGDYALYARIHGELLLKAAEAFAAAGIQLALPARAVFLNK